MKDRLIELVDAFAEKEMGGRRMSKRYIDADAFLKREITRCRCVPLVGSGSDDYKNLQELLEETSTADVVELDKVNNFIQRLRSIIGAIYHSDIKRVCEDLGFDYCSHGERKEQ